MLVTHAAALGLARVLGPVIAQLWRHRPDAADQVERAANSIVLDLAEAVAARADGITGEIRRARVVVGPLEHDPRRLAHWRPGRTGPWRGDAVVAPVVALELRGQRDVEADHRDLGTAKHGNKQRDVDSV